MEDSESVNEKQDKVETIEYTFEQATQDLRDAYNSDEYNSLHAIVTHKTYLQSMHKGRSETIYSALLAWVFRNPEFSVRMENPLIKLLRLLAHNSISQQENGHSLMPENFRNDILANAISVKTEVVETEVETKGIEDGRIDLIVGATINFNDSKKEKIVRILLENKIDSDEGKNQCLKYYKYFCEPENKNVVINNQERESDVDIFVFLSIEDPKKTLSDKEEFGHSKYIHITYQEVYDNVLKPLSALSQHFSQSTNAYLKDFMDTMTTLDNSGKMQIVMAPETRALLKKFYENNRDLINQAVIAGCKDPMIIKAIENNQRRKGEYCYRVTTPWGDSFESNQGDLLPKCVEAYWKHNPQKTPAEIEDYFPKIGEKSIFNTDNANSGYTTIEVGGKAYEISNQKTRKDANVEKLNQKTEFVIILQK